MWKSASAWPGARATFFTRPMRRSELMNVPSFSPQPAAGSTRSRAAPSRSCVHVLHDEEIELARAASLNSLWWIHECDGLVAMTHSPLIFPSCDAFDDLVVGQLRLVAECGSRRCRGCRRPSARCVGVREIVAAEQVRGVAEQPRTHRVALAGDGVRAGAGPADVAGHQREIDDGLRRARGSRGPGSRPSSTRTTRACRRRSSRRSRQSSLGAAGRCPRLTRSGVKRRDELRELVEARGVRVDELAIDPAAGDQDVREAIEQRRDRSSAAMAKCCVAAIAVSVLRGSMTMISGWCRLRITRCHMIGCAMHGFEPMNTSTSYSSKSA